jgi:hypothetical protein
MMDDSTLHHLSIEVDNVPPEIYSVMHSIIDDMYNH